MEKGLAEALLDFYETILNPEFDVIKGQLAEHDRRFEEILLRCELEEANWRRRQSSN